MRSGKMFKAFTSFALVAAMVVPTIVSPAENSAAKKPAFSTKSMALTVGSSQTVSVKNAAKKASFSWKSGNTKVASVAGKGSSATIKGVAAGTAKITCVVKKGKRKNTVSGLTVKVSQQVTSFAMQDSSSKACTSANIKVGEAIVLKAAVNNNAPGSTTNQKITWKTSSAAIAKVKKKNVNSATVTGVSAGTATITATLASTGKGVTCTVNVAKGGSNSNTNTNNANDKKDDGKKGTPTATPEPTVKPLDKGWIYKQKYEVTRWYDPGSYKGHEHDGYKNNNFAIWMVGFFDNEFSTNESKLMAYGPDLTHVKNAEFTSDKGEDFRKNGKAIHIKGEFSYEGTDQKTILLQINYTSPSDYPIMWKWEKGAPTGMKGSKEAKELNIDKDSNGSDALKSGETGKVDFSFTIPSNAKNGDIDESTGENYGIYIYFPNKPGGALAYRSDNTFHFKNFQMTY